VPSGPAPVAVIRQSDECITLAGFVRFDGRDSKHERAYRWDFGDGTTSTRPAPIHAYALVPKVYTVTLTVTGPGGEDTATSTVTVPCPTP
jgi:PKD repeat protein